MQPANYLKDVREHYELYPYPHRDPEDEKKRCLTTQLDYLDQINHYCFSGKRDFSKSFRALVAGGGTGDSAIFLAEQLRHTDSEVVYLDMSEASMQVAQERARARGLTNIRWEHRSLLDVSPQNSGLFDYINCSGVLHHLANPEAGLRALASILKEEGALGIMVYAQYGRTAIYQVQDAMRLINQNETEMPEKVKNCIGTLESLNRAHWFNIAGNDKIEDITKFGASGVYDLFLHSQDRAYTIPQLYEFVANSDLKIGKLLGYEDPLGNHVYDPAYYIKDSALLNKIKQLDDVTQKAVGELLNGQIKKHVFYAAKNPAPVPMINYLGNVPSLTLAADGDLYASLYNLARNSNDIVTVKQPNKGVSFQKTEHTELLVRFMDGKSTLRQIFTATLSEKRMPVSEENLKKLLGEFYAIYTAMSAHNWMFLRDSSVPPYRTMAEIDTLK